jgi:hypothetical protein
MREEILLVILLITLCVILAMSVRMALMLSQMLMVGGAQSASDRAAAAAAAASATAEPVAAAAASATAEPAAAAAASATAEPAAPPPLVKLPGLAQVSAQAVHGPCHAALAAVRRGDFSGTDKGGAADPTYASIFRMEVLTRSRYCSPAAAARAAAGAAAAGRCDAAAIIEHAKRHLVPPMALVRALPAPQRELISGAELALVAAADASAPARIRQAAATDQAFEERVAEFFARELGPDAFYTEAALRARPAAAGHSNLTPDILFKQPIVIEQNGRQHTVNWIDAKNYCWYGSKLTLRSITAQAKKYRDAFGPGAFLFHHGVADIAAASPSIALDGRFL